MTYFSINGHIVPAENATISVDDRGFKFGDGVFETIAVHNTVPYQFEWHMKRMASGLSSIRIAFDTASLQNYARQLIAKNQIKSGVLRIQVTRGIGSKGYMPDPTHPKSGATCVMEAYELPPIPLSPIAMWQSSYQKISAKALPVNYKLCQGLNSTLAKMEAVENHCAEALQLNEQGHMCETSSGNLFWLKAGKLYTPSAHCGILLGSTRAAIMRLSPYPVEEVETGFEALAGAEAVFISNVAYPVLAIGALSPASHQWNSEKTASEFRQLVLGDRETYSQSQSNQW